MTLTTLIAIPLIGSVVVFLLPAAKAALAKFVSLGFAVATLLGTALIAIGMDNSTGALQSVESYDWIPAFGISWTMGVDGISVALIVMAAILVPIVMIAGWWDAETAGRGSVKGFFSLILVLEALIIGVFAANDLFVFYVF